MGLYQPYTRLKSNPTEFNKKPDTFHAAATPLKSNTSTWNIYRCGERRVTFGEQQEFCDGTEMDGRVRSVGS